MKDAGWAEVPPADLARRKPDDFTDDELDLPYYLAHFHRVANSVVATGENRGFLDLSVWRSPKDNKPYNARIMESILSLAFFYATDRPWNVYHKHPAVRARLEAALDFWCRIQNKDGRFSEYGPQEWNLAATAFATKFMGGTLTLLHKGPPIDPALLQRVVAADRRAIQVVLTDAKLYETGKTYSNQYTNVWAGALAFLALFPDAEMDRLLRQRIRQSEKDFQSPAGYFYEAGGPDWGYNLGTHHSNLTMALHYARGTDLERFFVEEERRFVTWLAYNAAREPDGTGYTLNRGIETRQRLPFLTERGITGTQGGFLAKDVELARAFVVSRETAQAQIAERRARLARDWPRVEPLPVGEFTAYTPYAFLHRSHERWFPAEAERAAAIETLPYRQRRAFVHQRMDSRFPVVFTYIRRPSYYAALNTGRHVRPQQRYGLGLLWHPRAGALLQSQTDGGPGAWGTRADGSEHVYEAATIEAQFHTGDRPLSPRVGAFDLPEGGGVLRASYPLQERGRKTLTFETDTIAVSVRHAGTFSEQIPLLLAPGEKLGREPGRVTLARSGQGFTLHHDPSNSVDVIETKLEVGRKRIVALRIAARDTLDYRFDFSPS